MKLIVNVRFLQENLTGVGRFGYEVCKRLMTHFSQIQFVAPKNIPQHYVEELNIHTFGKLKGALWEQIELPLFLARNRSTLLNLANTCPIFYSNNCLVIHDIIPLTNPEWYSLQARFYYRTLLPLAIRSSRTVITVSKANKKEIHELLGTPLEKIHVVSNAVSDFWQPVNEKPLYDHYVLAVGSLDPRKNLKRLIQAFLQLPDKSLKLVIVGHKHKAFAAEEFSLSAEDSERIIFTGYMSDEEVRNLYSNALLFVYPSLKEGFGIPPLEAMKCECPVVASRIPSINEVCAASVEYIEDPSDVHSIYSALAKVLSEQELRQELRTKGLARASTFTWEDTASKIAKILTGLNG